MTYNRWRVFFSTLENHAIREVDWQLLRFCFLQPQDFEELPFRHKKWTKKAQNQIVSWFGLFVIFIRHLVLLLSWKYVHTERSCSVFVWQKKNKTYDSDMRCFQHRETSLYGADTSKIQSALWKWESKCKKVRRSFPFWFGQRQSKLKFLQHAWQT